MTVAKMGLIFCDLVESGIVKKQLFPLARLWHTAWWKPRGWKHYRYDPKMNDRELFRAGYNRVFTIRSNQKRISITWKRSFRKS